MAAAVGAGRKTPMHVVAQKGDATIIRVMLQRCPQNLAKEVMKEKMGLTEDGEYVEN